MAIDGEKLRRLRETQGMSQEKLALMCDVNKRTIQRAEAGNSIALETAAFLADALNVKPDALRAPRASNDDAPKPSAWNEVVLVPTSSGRRIIDAIRLNFDASISYDVEPTTENVDLLSAFAARLQSVYSNPNLPPWENPELTDAEVLRIQAALNEEISALASLGIRVFLTAYTADRVVPYLAEEGFMATTRGQSTKCVEVAIVVVTDTSASHLVRRPSDYKPPF